MFKHILMPTDGSQHSERAIERGIELARLCGARVTGIHVVPDYNVLLAYEASFDTTPEGHRRGSARTREDLPVFRATHGRCGRRAVRNDGGDERSPV